jgi:alkanesulfonate monooxygenase SsuD/methylene tetrahydromethanopterin reductase-like flavin-dependent oxidoreductase (luciferase family)
MNGGGDTLRQVTTYSICGLTAESFDSSPDGRADEMARVVRYAELAEEHGLDGVFVSEHHCVREGHLSSPLLALAALAQATDRVTIGTNIALAPLYQPTRLAEDLATIDLLSRGRAVFGMGLGYRPEEFDLFQVPRNERVRRLIACVDAVRAAWDSDEADPHAVTPRPFRPRGVPIWIGAFAEPGVRRARRIADGFIAPTLSTRAFQRRVGWLAEEGDLSNYDIVATLSGFVGTASVWNRVSGAIGFIEERYKRWLVEADDLPGAKDLHDRYVTLERPPHLVVGTPAECVAQLQPWVETLSTLPHGANGHVHLRLGYPGIEPAMVAESIRLFATEVVPALRAQESSSPV